MTEEEISDMIKEVDLDGDGKVNSPYAVIGRRWGGFSFVIRSGVRVWRSVYVTGGKKKSGFFVYLYLL